MDEDNAWKGLIGLGILVFLMFLGLGSFVYLVSH